jgi:hypothetical protein
MAEMEEKLKFEMDTLSTAATRTISERCEEERQKMSEEITALKKEHQQVIIQMQEEYRMMVQRAEESSSTAKEQMQVAEDSKKQLQAQFLQLQNEYHDGIKANEMQMARLKSKISQLQTENDQQLRQKEKELNEQKQALQSFKITTTEQLQAAKQEQEVLHAQMKTEFEQRNQTLLEEKEILQKRLVVMEKDQEDRAAEVKKIAESMHLGQSVSTEEWKQSMAEQQRLWSKEKADLSSSIDRLKVSSLIHRTRFWYLCVVVVLIEILMSFIVKRECLVNTS